MGGRNLIGVGLFGFAVLRALGSLEGGEWEDYLKSPYQDFRWNWLIRDGHLAYGQGRYKDALAVYHEAMRKGCRDPLMLFRTGYCYRALRKEKDAEKYFAASVKGLGEAYPKHRYNWFSRYYLAELFFEKGSAKGVKKEKASEYNRKALKELEEAVKLNPKFGQAFLLYGNIYYQQGEYELAAEKYRRAYEVNRKSAQALINLGACCDAGGKYEDAVQAYLKAKELSPGNVNVSLSLASVYAKTGRTREALTEYREVLKVQPDSEKALMGAGNAAWKSGENEKAVEYYQRALAVNLRSYEALLGLGLAMLKKKEEFEKAEGYFTKCLEVKPNSKEAHFNLGVLHDSRGDFDSAIKEFVRAIEIDPDDESCYYNVGLAFIKAGLYEEARSYLDKAIKTFGKESKWSRANLKLLELIDKIEKGKEAEVEKELERARKVKQPTGGQ